jgi:hypothetical protein
MKRTQIYLDESQDELLARRAAAMGTTKSDLIRQALGDFLAGNDERVQLESFRAAARAAAGTVSRLPAGRRYVEDLRKADAERSADLERRRRA